MALTKISRTLLDTGVSDSSDATAITIDSSENVGIGETTVNSKLEIKQGSANWYEGIRINRSSNTTQFGTFSNNSGATFIGAADTTGGSNNALLFGNSTDGTTFTERMRIDSSGNVGIGDSNPSSILDINATAPIITIESASANDSKILFAEGNANAVSLFYEGSAGTGTANNFHIRSELSGGEANLLTVGLDGSVGIGNSSPATWAGNLLQTGGQSLFGQLTTNAAAYMVNNTAYDGSNWKYITNGTASIYAQDHSDSNAHVWYTVASGTAGNNATLNQQMKLDVNGNLIVNNLHGSTASNPAVKYNATSGLLYYDTSSIRYKENVQDLPNSLEKIKALRPVTFDEKSTGDSCTGLIAEEVIEQIPDLVHLLDVEGYDTPQPNSVDYAKLSVYLLKAIQEQQTVIEDLKSRIETLEG